MPETAFAPIFVVQKQTKTKTIDGGTFLLFKRYALYIILCKDILELLTRAFSNNFNAYLLRYSDWCACFEAHNEFFASVW